MSEQFTIEKDGWVCTPKLRIFNGDLRMNGHLQQLWVKRQSDGKIKTEWRMVPMEGHFVE